MYRAIVVAFLACVGLVAAVASADRASADIVISVNKATQTLVVLVDGVERHNWTVSTGLAGGPPNGAFKVQRLERMWYSRTFHNSPMPYSIFFHGPYAIHGTYAVARLGHRASMGCVRLHPKNAATLFDLVRTNPGKTQIVVAVSSHVAAPPPMVEAPAAAAVVIPAKLEVTPPSDATGTVTPATPAGTLTIEE